LSFASSGCASDDGADAVSPGNAKEARLARKLEGDTGHGDRQRDARRVAGRGARAFLREVRRRPRWVLPRSPKVETFAFSPTILANFVNTFTTPV